MYNITDSHLEEDILKKNNRLAIFDFDGTLVQTHLYSPVCNGETLKHFGITEFDEKKLIGCIGHPFSDFISQFIPDFPKEDIPKFFEILLSMDRIYVPKLAKTFDGISDSLSKLKDFGYTTAICTNADVKYLNLVDKTVNVGHFMDSIITLDDRCCKSESLDHLLKMYPDHNAVMVGDSRYDKIAAADCGIPFVGCSYGYDKDEMIPSQCSAVAHSGYEIFDAINSVF